MTNKTVIEKMRDKVMADHKIPSDVNKTHGDGQRNCFDVDQFLIDYDIKYTIKNDGKKIIYRLQQCVFDETHTGTDAAIIKHPNGRLGYHCFHDSCKKKSWKDARKAIAGDDKLTKYTTGSDGEQISPYFTDDAGYLCKRKRTSRGNETIRLANFTAQITAENIEDNGQDVIHLYMIEGDQHGRALTAIEIPADKFASMNWTHKWGASPAIEPGQSIKDYVRHAIQIANDAPKAYFYAHTGWRNIDGELAYITAAGAIGATNVSVKLSKENARYSIPLIPENEQDAMRASLSLIEIGKHDVMWPLFAIVYLAPLTSLLNPMPNFSIFLFGPTGTLKSTISALQLSHFGDFGSIDSLSNFEDTANSLEQRAFVMKDTLSVLDDLHPSSQKRDAQAKEYIAQRMIRGYSNRTGRSRMNSDTTEKGRYEPRGMLQITGEEVVSLQSTLARVLLIEITEGDIDNVKLTRLQEKLHLLPHAMSSYLHWLRPRIKDIQKNFPVRFRELREKAAMEGSHKKLPEQVAFLAFTVELVTAWLLDKKVIGNDEAEKLKAESWQVFSQLSAKHGQRIADEDPIRRFEDIVIASLMQSSVRVSESSVERNQESNPPLVGYYEQENDAVFLMPTPLWHQVHSYCRAEGTFFPISKTALYNMLRERKMIEPGKGDNNLVTKWLDDKTMKVLKLTKGDIFDYISRKERKGDEAA